MIAATGDPDNRNAKLPGDPFVSCTIRSLRHGCGPPNTISEHLGGALQTDRSLL
jgi:hypothetical protein